MEEVWHQRLLDLRALSVEKDAIAVDVRYMQNTFGGVCHMLIDEFDRLQQKYSIL